MLRHQTSPTETSVKSVAASAAPQVSNGAGAAQLRVTPEELAQALAALDARRMQTAHDQSNTIAIGDALNELKVDATPEEVAAEVEAQRNANRATKTEKAQEAKKRFSSEDVLVGLFALKFYAIVGLAIIFVLATGSLYVLRAIAGSRHSLPVATPQSVARSHGLTMDRILVNQKDKNGTVTIKTLAEVGDDQTVSVNSGALIQATNLTLGDYTETSQSSNRRALWTVVKHNGAPYVHGFLSAPLSPGALRLGNVVITNEMTKPDGRKCGASPTPIAIRMDKIAGIVDNIDVQEADGAYRVSDGNWERFTLPTVAPDAVYTPISKP